MQGIKGLCHKCFTSNTELVIKNTEPPICKKCKFASITNIVIDSSNVT